MTYSQLLLHLVILVLAKSHSDVSSRLITKYKYKDFKKLQRIFVVKTVVLNFAEEFIVHQIEEFHSLMVLGQKLNLQVSHEASNKVKGLQAAQPSNIILNTVLL